MDIEKCTKKYENWLQEQLQDLEGFDAEKFEQEIDEKHKAMKAGNTHAFLRGTFYRWAKLWADTSTQEANSGVVIPVVGDTHVENFGTWRDVQGRLVWGVNDFDEACSLPWTSDLVRLGVSAQLALESEKIDFDLSKDEICDQIYLGYTETFSADSAAPMVLQELNDTLREFAWKLIVSKSPKKWWKEEKEKLELLTVFPNDPFWALTNGLPGDCKDINVYQRNGQNPAGMGSRGKPRYYAMAKWRGAEILREAKAIVPSALKWATNGRNSGPGLVEMLELAVRCPDPFHSLRGRWAVRRLAPDSSKIELDKIHEAGATRGEKRDLFKSMGAELANLHLGTASLRAVDKKDDLCREVNAWCKDVFRERVETWNDYVTKDFRDFCDRF